MDEAGVVQDRVNLLARDLLGFSLSDLLLPGREPRLLGQGRRGARVVVEVALEVVRQSRLGLRVDDHGAVRQGLTGRVGRRHEVVLPLEGGGGGADELLRRVEELRCGGAHSQHHHGHEHQGLHLALNPML